MKRLLSILTCMFILVAGCTQKKNSTTPSSDAEFQTVSQEFIKGYLDWRPIQAVRLGYHDYDGKITDLSKTSIESEIARLKKFDKVLNGFDTVALSAPMLYDLTILKYAVMSEIVNLGVINAFNKNPLLYAQSLDISPYILRDFAPMEDRLRSIIRIEQQVPATFEAARINLSDSLPRPYIETAIKVVKGNADFLAEDVLLAVKDVKNDSLIKEFKAVNDQAIKELKSFAEYLEKEKLPKANDHYAIGKANYKKMLQGEGIELSPERILEIGMSELEKEKATFYAAAKIIDSNKAPVDVLNDLLKEHPTSGNLIPAVKEYVVAIHQFIIDHLIVSCPSEVQVEVKETPKYARSLSAASMNVPGPYEKKATEGYYFVTPVEPEWSNKQKEDWLSMFERYTSSVISIHEVYPGHYTQFVHLQKSSATPIEKIFTSYSFMEGWAHYTEKMMLDEGFGDSGNKTQAAKYKLAQSAESLLRLCRLCVSVKMHCEGMTVDEAKQFFMNNWGNGEQPSMHEAMRGTFDPGYLFYTLGKLEFLKLREDYRQQEGANFSLKKFHDLVLSQGSPPLILLRRSLLKDKDSWNQIL